MRRVLLLLLVFLAAPVLAPYDPLQTNPPRAYLSPSLDHLLGTDQLGRDVLSRTLHGGQTSIIMTLAATLGVVTVATIWIVFTMQVDIESRIIRIVIDTNAAFRTIPTIVIASVILTVLQTTPTTIIISTIITQTPHTVHWIYERTIEIHKMPHIEGAKTAGATKRHIYLHHIAPLLLQEAATQTILTAQTSLLTISTLTFLGFGVRLENPEWGLLLREGREAFRTAPWIATAPGFCITFLSTIALQQSTKKAMIKRPR
jgi:peptide/nickel transport system permease protein